MAESRCFEKYAQVGQVMLEMCLYAKTWRERYHKWESRTVASYANTRNPVLSHRRENRAYRVSGVVTKDVTEFCCKRKEGENDDMPRPDRELRASELYQIQGKTSESKSPKSSTHSKDRFHYLFSCWDHNAVIRLAGKLVLSGEHSNDLPNFGWTTSTIA